VVLNLLAFLSGQAVASRPPPDYRNELHRSAAAQIEVLAARSQIEEALDFGKRFTRRVEPAPIVLYEIALLHNRLGQFDEAMTGYGRVLELDSEHAAARYDRGELLLEQGQIDRAQADLEVAARLAPEHWVVHFRLAELAGARGDANALEAHLVDAIRHGFSLETLAQSPSWRSWIGDPVLGTVINRVILIYGDESLLDRLLNQSPTAPR
jgi:tetratricopeptide (TPR) repeat protein